MVGERLYRSFETNIRKSSDGKRYTFAISTPGIDRHRTIIEPGGIDIDAFKRNPVVLFNHDYDRVIGKAVNVQMRGESLIAEVEFDQEDEFARSIESKVDRKFLNGASIGFMVRSEEEDTDEEGRSFTRITDTELVEFSVVTVPSNRDALVLDRSIRGELAEVKDALSTIKDEFAELSDKISVRAALEAPVPSTDEAEDAEPVAEAVPEEPPTHATEVIHVEPRKATEDDYKAFAKALAPVVRNSVLVALGRK